MVKSGEIQYTVNSPLSDSSRPRLIFNPSDNLCGLLTYVQDYLFQHVKSIEDSFVHGDNCDMLKQRISRILGPNPSEYVSLSLDGSAFDSSQHYELIQAVDQQFFHNAQNYIRDVLQMICLNLNIKWNPKLLERIMEQATDIEQLAFFDLPDLPVLNPTLSK